MIVLMNCLSSISGGAVSYLKNIYPCLAEEFGNSCGKNSLHLLLHESQLSLFPVGDRAFFHILEGPRPTGFQRIFWEKKNLNALIKEICADVLFVPYQVGGVGGVKQVLMIRNMEPFNCRGYRYDFRQWLRNRFLAYLSKRSLCKADRVIAVSEYAQNHLTEVFGIAPQRIRQIYHGRNTMFAPGDQVEDWKLLDQVGVKPGFILTCGSLLPYRRCEDVINAYAHMSRNLSDKAQLVVAGSGTDQSYKRLIETTRERSSREDGILLLGHVSQPIMAALYRQSRLCVIASEIEACPNIAIEAMTSGAVIVASDRAPLPEMFSGSALHYRARDINELSDAMVTALEWDNVRQNLKQSALSRAEDFSWKFCAHSTYDALVTW